MWYITNNFEKKLLGGLGHTFYDIFTSYAISRIYNIEHAYVRFNTNKVTKKYNNMNKENVDPQWDTFFNFGKDEVHANSLKKYKKVYINLVGRWDVLNKKILDKFFSNFNRNHNILFILTNNNRIFMWIFYNWCNTNVINPSLWDELRNDLKNKCTHKIMDKNKPSSPSSATVTVANSSICDRTHSIVIHIRKGDLDEPLSYSHNVLTTLKTKMPLSNYEIYILSYGDNSQLDEIKSVYKDFYVNKSPTELGDNYKINYKFNYNTVDSFKIMMDADILITASTFGKIGGYYSNGIVIYVPLKNKINKLKELYDSRWIPANIKGNFDIDSFMISLKEQS